ncbi:MAG: hypothetical protein PHS14_20705 [Elusimicrobia bacterium]|nr:hypothetical protein [Elusimicrobiota bacterium]
MASIVVGVPQLEARLRRMAQAERGGAPMKAAAIATVGALKRNVPRATGKTGASIVPMAIGPTTAEIWGSKVIVFLEKGTGLFGPKHHIITPLAAKALAFHSKAKGAAMGAKYRLTGRMTVGSARALGAGSDMVVVRSVKGMPAQPFIEQSMAEASALVGQPIIASIVEAWDR